ncbi:uncharacterized protein LOC135689622 [Rhopilema esculentum]|uniref:uncharacterized protein LOC135689622 n=1 Tax=Rhopilema esculentum TaxID=499914 RepID=UPI0031E0E2AB
MACENEELIQIKAEKQEEDAEIAQPSSYNKKDDPACKILKECDNCKFKTEKEGPMCFNLFGENDFCRPTFTETLSDINEKNDNLLMQIYGANSEFIGRSLEVCSRCNVFQVHNLFSRTENELCIKLNLRGFAQAVSNNIIKTCESRSKETRCQMVGICNLPRSSPAYAILHGDESLDPGRCQNLKIASPNEKITYQQSLLGRPSRAEYLTSTEETGKPRLIKSVKELASFDLNSYKHFSSINESHNLPMKESAKYLEMHTSSGNYHGYDMPPSRNPTRTHDSLFTESSLLSEYGGEYFKLRYGSSPSGLENIPSLRTVTTSRNMSPYLDTSIRSEESSPSQVCNPQGSLQSSVPSDCNATTSSIMLGDKRPHDRLEEHPFP